MTLDDIKGRCRIDGDCWIWAGGTSNGVPRIWAPDYTNADGGHRSQSGRRAVWNVVHKRKIADGYRVFGTCNEPLCLNPEHSTCIKASVHGARLAESGLKGDVVRVLRNRAIGRKRSKLTPELIELILSSPKTGVDLSKETGLKRQLISKVRTHGATSFQPIGGFFAGLGVSTCSKDRYYTNVASQYVQCDQ